MISLIPLSDTQYKVQIDSIQLSEEESTKLLRKRDHFPSEFVHMLIDLIPEHQSFQTYDHYQMILNVTAAV